MVVVVVVVVAHRTVESEKDSLKAKREKRTEKKKKSCLNQSPTTYTSPIDPLRFVVAIATSTTLFPTNPRKSTTPLPLPFLPPQPPRPPPSRLPPLPPLSLEGSFSIVFCCFFSGDKLSSLGSTSTTTRASTSSYNQVSPFKKSE